MDLRLHRVHVDSPIAALLSLPSAELLELVARRLQVCVDENDAAGYKGTLTRFHARTPPDVRLDEYLSRLVKYTPYTKDTIILSLLYLNRISYQYLVKEVEQALYHSLRFNDPEVKHEMDPTTSTDRLPTIPLSSNTGYLEHLRPLFPETRPAPPSPASSPNPSSSFSREARNLAQASRPALTINSFTIHRLLLSTLLLASKFVSDWFIPQARVAKVAGVSSDELKGLEIEVLVRLDFSLYWQQDDLERMCGELLRARQVTPPSSANPQTPTTAELQGTAPQPTATEIKHRRSLESRRSSSGDTSDSGSAASFQSESSLSSPFSPEPTRWLSLVSSSAASSPPTSASSSSSEVSSPPIPFRPPPSASGKRNLSSSLNVSFDTSAFDSEHEYEAGTWGEGMRSSKTERRRSSSTATTPRAKTFGKGADEEGDDWDVACDGAELEDDRDG